MGCVIRCTEGASVRVETEGTRPIRHGNKKTPTIVIRSFEASDAPVLADIYVTALEQLARHAYTSDQLRVWRAHAPSPAMIRDAYGDGRLALVALDECGDHAGFSDLERNGHIQYLYTSPHAAGRGVARALLARLEDEAQVLGIVHMFAEASEVALPVFERAGFVRLRRRDFEIDGVVIHNYAVEKRLLSGPDDQSANGMS